MSKKYYNVEIKDCGEGIYKAYILEDAEEYHNQVIVWECETNNFYDAMMKAFVKRKDIIYPSKSVVQ